MTARNRTHSMLTFAAAALACATLTIGSAEAATWYTIASGSANKTIDVLTDWTDQADGSAGTSPGAQPVAGNADTWVVRGNRRLGANPSNTEWFGGTLQILAVPSNDGEFLLFNEDFAVQNVILDGGALNIGQNGGAGNPNRTLTGKTLTLNSGIMGIERTVSSWIGTYDFDTYTGSGNIELRGRVNGANNVTQSGHLQFADGGDFSGFTGIFTVVDSVTLGFAGDIDDPSFGIVVEEAALGSNQGFYNLLNDIAVTSLTLGGDIIANGTYTYGDFTLAQQAFLIDSNGSITVGTLVPEPASLALWSMIGLGLAGFRVWRRRTGRVAKIAA